MLNVLHLNKLNLRKAEGLYFGADVLSGRAYFTSKLSQLPVTVLWFISLWKFWCSVLNSKIFLNFMCLLFPNAPSSSSILHLFSAKWPMRYISLLIWRPFSSRFQTCAMFYERFLKLQYSKHHQQCFSQEQQTANSTLSLRVTASSRLNTSSRI